MKKKSAGFTLIEILIVIAIISILSIGGLASYTASLKNSRDAKRKTDLEQIRVTLEIYKSDTGSYTISGAGQAAADGSGFFNLAYDSNPSIAQKLVSDGYMSTELKDESPVSADGNGYYVAICDGGARYALWTKLENPAADNAATNPNHPDNITGECVTGEEDDRNYIVINP